MAGGGVGWSCFLRSALPEWCRAPKAGLGVVPRPLLPGDSGGFGPLLCCGERRRQCEGRGREEMGPVRMPSSMCKPARVAQGISGATVSLFFFFSFLSLPQVTLASTGGVFILGPACGSLGSSCCCLARTLQCLFASLGALWAHSSTPMILIWYPLAALTDSVLLGWMFELTETKGRLIYRSSLPQLCFCLLLYLVRPKTARD